MIDNNKLGHIYVIGENGRVKIGTSVNPQKRIDEVYTSSGLTRTGLEFISEAVHNHYSLEAEIHKFFLGQKICGEWFNITVKDGIDFVKSSCKKVTPEDIAIANHKNEASTIKVGSFCDDLISGLMEQRVLSDAEIKFNKWNVDTSQKLLDYGVISAEDARFNSELSPVECRAMIFGHIVSLMLKGESLDSYLEKECVK